MADITLRGLTVLLAESREEMRQAIRSGMRGVKDGASIDFLEAFDGGSALAILADRDKPVDIVLIDWEMVPMDGPFFLNLLRHDADYTLHQKTPVISITSLATPSMTKQALGLGSAVIMQKPISPTDLASRILAVLNAKSPFIRVPDGLGAGKDYVGPLTKYAAEAFVAPAQAQKRPILKL